MAVPSPQYPSIQSPATLIKMDHPQLRKSIFDHFYHTWYNDNLRLPPNKRHSLPRFYPNPSPPLLTSLNIYLLTPVYASVSRSRIRFGRSLLGNQLHRLYRNPTPYCPHCSNEIETVFHVLCLCPVYDYLRYQCSVALSFYGVSLSPRLVLDFPTLPIPPLYHKYIHHITTTFLVAVRRARKF